MPDTPAASVEGTTPPSLRELAERLERGECDAALVNEYIAAANPAAILELLAEVESLRSALREAQEDTRRLDWWFGNGLEDSVCEGSVDLWWADDAAEQTRVTHGVSVRDTLDKAMRGEFEPDDAAAKETT